MGKELLLVAEAVSNDYPEGSILELSEYCSNETSRDSVELGLRRPNEPLQGNGWGNYGQEKHWASCFYNSIFEKTRKLNNSYILFLILLLSSLYTQDYLDFVFYHLLHASRFL